MRGLRCGAAGALFAVVALVVGCSGDGDFGDVSGTVSYDGQPVEDGQVKFTPTDGKGSTGGGTIKNGKYTATKVPIGNTKVFISGSKVVGTKPLYNTPGSPVGNITAELLPAKYNEKSDLTFEVKRGSNEKNWELTK